MQRLRLSRPFALRCLLAAAAACPAWTAAPAPAQDGPPLRSETAPFFTADVVTSLDEAGNPRLSVGIAVAYDELQWVRVPRGHAAGAELSVVFDRGGGRRAYGDVWERRLAVAGFDATNSNVSALLERRTFDLPPGRYQMRVQVRDVNSGSTSSAARPVQVPDFSAMRVGFAGLELGVLDDGGAFRGTPTRRFGRDADRIAAKVVLFDRRPGDWPRIYPFRYRIVDESGATSIEGERRMSLERSGAPVLVRPDSSGLFIGSYVFEVELVEDRSRWRVERSFEVEESGPPRGRDFERLLEPLSLLVEDGPMDTLRALPPERQAEGWDAFWRPRDPDPDTPRNEALLEFLRRVRYVDRHFRDIGPGWRSDRGRIYVRHGDPDQVETRPEGINGLRLEIWYYDRPYRRYVFMDRDGFGRFVLVEGPRE